MASVRNLTDILPLIVHGLNERALPQQQFLLQAHQTILPVLADFRQQRKSLGEQDIMECLRDRPAVAEALA